MKTAKILDLPADRGAHRPQATANHEIRGQLSGTPPGEGHRQYEKVGL
jgi:hypothetical protein